MLLIHESFSRITNVRRFILTKKNVQLIIANIVSFNLIIKDYFSLKHELNNSKKLSFKFKFLYVNFLLSTKFKKVGGGRFSFEKHKFESPQDTS